MDSRPCSSGSESRVNGMGRWICGIFLTLIVAGNGLVGQDLQALRREMLQLEKNLNSKRDSEKTLVEQVEDDGREISLRKKLLAAFDNEKEVIEKRIAAEETRLVQTMQGYERLKEFVTRRVVAMYKRGPTSDWEILLTMNSINQVLVWSKYQKRIMETDRKNLRLLENKKSWIQDQRRSLVLELEGKNRIIAEKKAESDVLEEKKRSRQGLLKRVTNDKEALEERLRKKRLVYNQIIGRIDREEKRRQQSAVHQTLRSPSGSFSSLKGKLNWPVRGRIVSRYGKQQHPVLKTWTDNLGIDIKANPGDPVVAVGKGKVLWVTWQRGMENLVLIEHEGGFYTVYGHLDEVLVKAGEDVAEGRSIGRVGDNQSLSGPTLHFGVWNGTDHNDPEIWLR